MTSRNDPLAPESPSGVDFGGPPAHGGGALRAQQNLESLLLTQRLEVMREEVEQRTRGHDTSLRPGRCQSRIADQTQSVDASHPLDDPGLCLAVEQKHPGGGV